VHVSSLVRHSRVVSAALAVLFTCSAVCVSAGGAFAAGSSILWHSVAIGSAVPECTVWPSAPVPGCTVWPSGPVPG
jgi:hypothetical protein